MTPSRLFVAQTELCMRRAELDMIQDWIQSHRDAGLDPRPQDLEWVVWLESQIAALKRKIVNLTRFEDCPTGKVGDP